MPLVGHASREGRRIAGEELARSPFDVDDQLTTYHKSKHRFRSENERSTGSATRPQDCLHCLDQPLLRGSQKKLDQIDPAHVDQRTSTSDDNGLFRIVEQRPDGDAQGLADAQQHGDRYSGFPLFDETEETFGDTRVQSYRAKSEFATQARLPQARAYSLHPFEVATRSRGARRLGFRQVPNHLRCEFERPA